MNDVKKPCQRTQLPIERKIELLDFLRRRRADYERNRTPYDTMSKEATESLGFLVTFSNVRYLCRAIPGLGWAESHRRGGSIGRLQFGVAVKQLGELILQLNGSMTVEFESLYKGVLSGIEKVEDDEKD